MRAAAILLNAASCAYRRVTLLACHWHPRNFLSVTIECRSTCSIPHLQANKAGHQQTPMHRTTAKHALTLTETTTATSVQKLVLLCRNSWPGPLAHSQAQHEQGWWTNIGPATLHASLQTRPSSPQLVELQHLKVSLLFTTVTSCDSCSMCMCHTMRLQAPTC